MSWIFYIGNWIARRKLKKSYEHYDRMLWLPILHKNICDFKFIRRDPLKSVHRSQKKQMFSSQATTTNDDGILILGSFIAWVSSLCNNYIFYFLYLIRLFSLDSRFICCLGDDSTFCNRGESQNHHHQRCGLSASGESLCSRLVEGKYYLNFQCSQ